jgi:mevalonate kinase
MSYRLSEVERQRRSERAKRMHAEGRLGHGAVARRAAQKSVAVRQERASAVAQRLLLDHAEEVERALLDALRRGSPTVRLRAVETIMKSALRAEGVTVEAERAEAAMTRDELVAALAAKLTGGPAGAIVRAEIERQALDAGIVDAEG